MKIVQKIKEKKQQVLRFLFGSFSATALMFTFQACYGPPSSYLTHTTIRGTVTDAEMGEPVPGLEVSSPGLFTAITDQEGRFEDPAGERYSYEWDTYTFQVNDIDSTENGVYETLDTSIKAIDLENPLQLNVRQHRDNS